MMSLKKFLFKDYEWEQQPFNNKKGYRWVYCYKGKWKQWNITGRRLFQNKMIISFLYLLCVFFFFYSSTVSCGINRIKAVQICTLLAFAGIAFLFIGVLFFIFSKAKMTEPDAILQKQLILWSAGFGAVILIVSVFLGIFSQELKLTQETIYVLICNVLAAVFEGIIFILQKKLIIMDA